MSERSKPLSPNPPAHTVETQNAVPPAPQDAPHPPAAEAPVPARSLEEKLGIEPGKKTEAPEPKAPKDVPGVKTIMAEDIPNAAPRIRVWEDGHSAEAAIVKNNEDDTFDLSADIWNTGQPITLVGVKRRSGLGNGWELIDENAEAKAKATMPHDEREGAAPAKVSIALITLRSPVAFNGVLEIGHARYQVTGGVVEVAPWDADAARAAGYEG